MSEIAQKVKSIIDVGQLVSDQLIIELIESRTENGDCKKGYILDGFPRTVAQSEALDRMLEKRSEKLSHVLLFNVTEEDLRSRLENRRGKEDRADDSLEIQLERLRVYQENTAPLIEFYESRNILTKIDGVGSIEEVSQRVVELLG